MLVKEYEKEFRNRLAHKQISNEFVDYEVTTKKLLDVYLKESAASNSESNFEYKEIDDAIQSLSSGTAPGPHPIPPDIFKIAGPGLTVIITKAFNRIKNNLSIPADWLENLIVTIYKNKGSRKVLEFYRGIFLGDILTKILEKVIKRRVEPKLSHVNILQAGSRTRRSPADCLFILNGVIDHAKYLKKTVYITFYDYSTCFDSLWLDDSMISLWNLGIRNELFHLVFKLNERTRIQVKTPFGLSEPFECHRIVKQGSVLSSNICSASTGELCDENQDGFAVIGDVLINDTLYVDDTTDYNSDINETIDSHNHVVNFAKSKRLCINHEKCCCMIINKKAHDSMPSLKIGENCIKQVSSTKFLGDMVNEKGDNKDLVSDRVQKGNVVMINSLSLCNEVTLGAHHTKVALILYTLVFVSTVLFNCQAWTNLTKDDIKKLETCQLKFLKRILRSPQSTPNCFMYLELGVLPLSSIIHIRQLSYLHHILQLDRNDPVRRIYDEQMSLPFEKNWGNQTKKLISMYNLEDLDPSKMSPAAWKQRVKTKVSDYVFQKLVDEAKSKSKTKHLTYSKFTLQPYMEHYNPKTVSTISKIRSRNVECKANRKSSSENLQCRLCGEEEETQQHIINCSKIRSDEEPELDLHPIMNQDVALNSTDVVEICRRISLFHDKASNP